MNASTLVRIAAIAVATVSFVDGAAAQKRTCTQAYDQCLRESRSSPKCADAQKNCLRTGVWIGPLTGRNAGFHLRK